MIGSSLHFRKIILAEEWRIVNARCRTEVSLDIAEKIKERAGGDRGQGSIEEVEEKAG